ncbi:MAG: hypothetical protein KDD65_07395, partial [Bacteroidetes bacterium]|nr:hypothetical protein [Bacteroidota bacterium]
ICGPTAGAVTSNPADVPYFTDFESTVGAEWNSTTRDYDDDFTNFLGRFNGAPVNLAINTTVGETYQLSFDFYSIDSWNPNSSNTNVDYFHIEVDGSEVFHETFSRREPSDSWTRARRLTETGTTPCSWTTTTTAIWISP